MKKIGRKRMSRAIALLMSLILVAGLSPAPALAAVGGIAKDSSSASTALVTGGGELEGQAGTRVRTQDGLMLGPLEVAIAKNLIEGAIAGLGSLGVSFGGKELLTKIFGDAFENETQQKLDQILKELQVIEKEIEALKDEVERVELDQVISDLKFLLGDTRPEELFNALADIDDKVAHNKMTTDEAREARLTALTDGLGSNGDYANADLPFDEFTDNMWTAVLGPNPVTLDGKSESLTLLQVHYELLRRSHKWEHQAYAEWGSYQGKCVSLLIST